MKVINRHFMRGVLNRIKKSLGKEQYEVIRSKVITTRDDVEFECRKLTSRFRCVPTGIIIGAMKSGTTSLFKNLTRYSRIYGSSKKEVHFFDDNYHKGIEWYKSHFPLKHFVGDNELIEATPKYIFVKNVPKRIKRCIPKVKIVLSLRDPIDRAISHYYHEVSRGREKREIERAIKENAKKISKNINRSNYTRTHFSYLERGHYCEQVRRYKRYFAEDKIKILKSERMFNETDKVVKEVAEFLVDDSLKKLKCKEHNMGEYRKRSNDEIREWLRDYYRPKNKSLYDLVGRDFGWEG